MLGEAEDGVCPELFSGAVRRDIFSLEWGSPGPRHPHEVPWMWPSPSLSTVAALLCILRDLVSPLAPAEGGLSGAKCGWGRCCWFNSGLWVALPPCPFSSGLRASHSPMSFALKWLLLVPPASGYLPSFSSVWKLPLGSLGGCGAAIPLRVQPLSHRPAVSLRCRGIWQLLARPALQHTPALCHPRLLHLHNSMTQGISGLPLDCPKGWVPSSPTCA